MNEPNRPKRRGVPRWAWIVVALLVTHTSAMIAAVVVAVDDPSFTAVPDYYERALAWDEHRDRQRTSDQLGWSATVEPSALGDRLVVVLTDREGEPVTGVAGELTAYHHARANERRTVALVERGDGVYFATLDVARVGAWQLTLVAERHAGEAFLLETEVVVRAPRDAS